MLSDHVQIFILCCFIVVLFEDPGKNKEGRTYVDENKIALFYWLLLELWIEVNFLVPRPGGLCDNNK